PTHRHRRCGTGRLRKCSDKPWRDASGTCQPGLTAGRTRHTVCPGLGSHGMTDMRPSLEDALELLYGSLLPGGYAPTAPERSSAGTVDQATTHPGEGLSSPIYLAPISDDPLQTPQRMSSAKAQARRLVAWSVPHARIASKLRRRAQY